MDEPLPLGIRRVTHPLPTRPGHVHSYLIPHDGAGWLVVDTGLGLPDAKERWAEALAGLEGPVTAIFVTHFHPDHVGAARDVAELTGAPVLQGACDLEQCRLVWGAEDWPEVLDAWFTRHGAPREVTDELIESGRYWAPFIRYADDAELVEAGQTVAGWEVIPASGHADGQLTLLRDGVYLAADHLLDPITPTVGLWPASRPDPLGDYLAALEVVVERAPVLALTGHGDPIADPPARARAIAEHHAQRLDELATGLGAEPKSAFDASLQLFGEELKPAARRFAMAEALSHLEYLALRGGAARVETAGAVAYTAP
ncbi:MAG: MBL fold metallo-hydrolase [Gaiellales bacterium]